MTYRARFGVAVVWAITVAAAIGSVAPLALSWDRALTDDLFSGFGVCRSRRCRSRSPAPERSSRRAWLDHAVGRLFLLIGGLLAVGLLAYQYAAYGLTRPGGVPAVTVAAWLANPASSRQRRSSGFR